ncbi:MAG TPA: hypothetical protein DCY79_00920, partial [Planctomycetaceae bacterium]|nr:hypothetical protein [Planctomycetaceae bacterium]
IAECDDYKIAVSVKTRLYRQGTKESRGTVFTYDHLDKLEHFAKRFDLDPVLAHAVCMEDDHIIHLFMIRTEDIRKRLAAVKHGHRLQFGPKYLDETIAFPYIDYSHWADESITSGLFVKPQATTQQNVT